jgi:hypothetical protein
VVKHYCDSCNRLLTEHELKENQKLQVSLQGTTDAALCNEIWCEVCINFAQKYITEKRTVVQELLEYSTNRINNHRKTFFKKAKRNVINDSGKVAGSDREEAHQ